MSTREPAWVIERMNPETDLERVLAVDRASFPHPWTRVMFKRELQHPDVSYVYVVRTTNEPVVGYCSAWVILDELHVNNLAVAPAWRRQGAGAALLVHVLRESCQLAARRATLEVRASNTAARRVYERFGFVVVGVRPGYYSRPTDDALILWRELVSESA